MLVLRACARAGGCAHILFLRSYRVRAASLFFPCNGLLWCREYWLLHWFESFWPNHKSQALRQRNKISCLFPVGNNTYIFTVHMCSTLSCAVPWVWFSRGDERLSIVRFAFSYDQMTLLDFYVSAFCIGSSVKSLIDHHSNKFNNSIIFWTYVDFIYFTYHAFTYCSQTVFFLGPRRFKIF